MATNFQIKNKAIVPLGPNSQFLVQNEDDTTGRVLTKALYPNTVGVFDLKPYVAKLSDTTISIDSGRALIRKTAGTVHEVSWPAVASQTVPTLTAGELRWIVIGWTSPAETAVSVQFLPTMPDALLEADRYAIIGRLWTADGTTLTVGEKHIRLLVDPMRPLSGANWGTPAYNSRASVTASPHTTPANLALSAGELVRWPVVADFVTGSHNHTYAGVAPIPSLWGHLRAKATFDVIPSGNCTAVFLSNSYDTGAATPTALPAGNAAIHRLGVYAASGERVWIWGQNAYTSVANALAALDSDSFSYAPWAADMGQISIIAKIIIRKGETAFVTSGANCIIIPWPPR